MSEHPGVKLPPFKGMAHLFAPAARPAAFEYLQSGAVRVTVWEGAPLDAMLTARNMLDTYIKAAQQSDQPAPGITDR